MAKWRFMSDLLAGSPRAKIQSSDLIFLYPESSCLQPCTREHYTGRASSYFVYNGYTEFSLCYMSASIIVQVVDLRTKTFKPPP